MRFDNKSMATRIKDTTGFVTITPVTVTCQASKGYEQVERRMPLVLNWAVRNKLQGITLDMGDIGLGRKEFAKGQENVATNVCLRVSNLGGIALYDQ